MGPDHLSTPVTVGSLRLRNRIVVAPMATNTPDGAGRVTTAVLEHYESLAGGGAAMVIVESAYVQVRGKASRRNLGIDTDECIPGLRELAQRIRAKGARACLQIWHAGSRALAGPDEAPLTPTGATPAEIAEVRESFVAAARRALEAGFDAVEVHAAHGYLLHEFLCPASNARFDEYGGDIAGRARLLLEILEGVAHVVADRAPLLVRISAGCEHSGGLSSADLASVAGRLGEVGCSAIDVSAGHSSSAYIVHPPENTPPGYLLFAAREVRSSTLLPTIVAGRFHSRRAIEPAFAGGWLDLVAVGRAFLADPMWGHKMLGPIDAPPRCTYCNRCYEAVKAGQRLRCRAD